MLPYTDEILSSVRRFLDSCIGSSYTTSRVETTLGENWMRITFRVGTDDMRMCMATNCTTESHAKAHMHCHVLVVDTEPSQIRIRVLSADKRAHPCTAFNPDSTLARIVIDTDDNSYSMESLLCSPQ